MTPLHSAPRPGSSVLTWLLPCAPRSAGPGPRQRQRVLQPGLRVRQPGRLRPRHRGLHARARDGHGAQRVSAPTRARSSLEPYFLHSFFLVSCGDVKVADLFRWMTWRRVLMLTNGQYCVTYKNVLRRVSRFKILVAIAGRWSRKELASTASDSRVVLVLQTMVFGHAWHRLREAPRLAGTPSRARTSLRRQRPRWSGNESGMNKVYCFARLVPERALVRHVDFRASRSQAS